MGNSFINAYLVNVSFFVWPNVGSGEHELVFASPQQPDESLSEAIVAAMAGKRLGKRLEDEAHKPFVTLTLDRNDRTFDWRWEFKAKYEEVGRKENEVSVTLTFSDLGNLLTDAGKEMHYLNGRLRYFKGDKVIPVYSSPAEVTI